MRSATPFAQRAGHVHSGHGHGVSQRTAMTTDCNATANMVMVRSLDTDNKYICIYCMRTHAVFTKGGQPTRHYTGTKDEGNKQAGTCRQTCDHTGHIMPAWCTAHRTTRKRSRLAQWGTGTWKRSASQTAPEQHTPKVKQVTKESVQGEMQQVLVFRVKCSRCYMGHWGAHDPWCVGRGRSTDTM